MNTMLNPTSMSTLKRSRQILTFCLIGFTLLANAVLAESAVDSQSTSEVSTLPASTRQAPDWSLKLGALLIHWPEYDGADASESVVYPLFTIDYRYRYFIDAVEGIGIRLFNSEQYAVAASVAYDPGRPEADSPHLSGLGDIDDGAAFKLKSEYRKNAFSYSISIINELSGNDTGFYVDLEAGYTRMLSAQVVLNPAVVARYGSDDYVERYFGVNDAQAQMSGQPVYNPEGALVSAGLQINALRMLTNNWVIQGQLSVEQILGDAADSPIVFDELQTTAAIGLVKKIF